MVRFPGFAHNSDLIVDVIATIDCKLHCKIFEIGITRRDTSYLKNFIVDNLLP